MSEQQDTVDIHVEPNKFSQRVWKFIPEQWRLNLGDSFQPENIKDRLIPGEEIQLEIQLAWYRDILGHVVYHYFRYLVFAMVIASIIIAVVSNTLGIGLINVLIPLAILLLASAFGSLERFDYLQFRLLKTNARLVISIPLHGSWPLVDNIELKGAPSILDTNWSPHPVWRVFQFFTGARDLYISMSGLQFVEGKAKVKDALIIPDIMPKDVFELKKLVFTPK